MDEKFFQRLGRAAGMAKQAMQKTKAQEFDASRPSKGMARSRSSSTKRRTARGSCC